MPPTLLITSSTGKNKSVYRASVKRLAELWKTSYGMDIDEDVLMYWNNGIGKKIEPWQHVMSVSYYHSLPIVYYKRSAMDALGEYMAAPSETTATRLLKEVNVPVPLKTLLDDKNNKNIRRAVAQFPSLSGIKCYGGGDNKVSISDELMKAMVLTDTYHDLLGNVPSEVRDWVFAQQKIFATKPSSQNYTMNVGKKWITESGANKDAFYNAVRTNGAFIETEDETLFNKFQSWSCRDELTLIVDGIERGNDVSSIIQTAVILMLFVNGTKLVHKALRLQFKKSLKSKLKKIHIMDGYFHALDHGTPPILPFLNNWARTLSRVINGKVEMVDTLTVPSDPLPSKYYMRTHVDAEGNVLLPNGTKVSTLQRWDAQNLPIQLPYRKHDLSIFLTRVELSAEQKDQLLDVFEVNFFRDAYMIDVALQTGAVFLTQDRLAFTFHTLLAMQHGLPTDAMFMQIKQIDKTKDPEYEFTCAV